MVPRSMLVGLFESRDPGLSFPPFTGCSPLEATRFQPLWRKAGFSFPAI